MEEHKKLLSVISQAKLGFQIWREKSWTFRKNCLKHYQNSLTDHKRELSEIISRETHKPYWESQQEVDLMIRKIDLSIQAVESRAFVQRGQAGSAKTHLTFEPIGILVVLGPFNLPGHLPNGQIVPALLSGNAVIFKPSEYTPETGILIEKLLWNSLRDCGMPETIFQCLRGGAELGQHLVAQVRDAHDLSGLLFTGSVRTGRLIHKTLGGYPEKLLALEMGGNNALVVDLDNLSKNKIDLKIVLNLVIQSAFITSGQRCTCARRLILISTNEQYKQLFLRLLMILIQDIKIGYYQEQPEPFMGPVISDQAAQTIKKQFDILCSKLIVKPEIVLKLLSVKSSDPKLLSPGVLLFPELLSEEFLKNPENLALWDQEIFGPVLQIFVVPDLKTAIRGVNQTRFGLAAGLISLDPKNYLIFRQSVRAGVINWNQALTGASGQLPFGGVGLSGNFRPGGFYMIDSCVVPVASLESENLN